MKRLMKYFLYILIYILVIFILPALCTKKKEILEEKKLQKNEESNIEEVKHEFLHKYVEPGNQTRRGWNI